MAVAEDRIHAWAEATLARARLAELPTAHGGLAAVHLEKAPRQPETRQVPTYHLVEVQPTGKLIANCVERALVEHDKAPDGVFVSILRYLSVVSQADSYPAHTAQGVILVQLRILPGLCDDQAEAAFAV